MNDKPSTQTRTDFDFSDSEEEENEKVGTTLHASAPLTSPSSHNQLHCHSMNYHVDNSHRYRKSRLCAADMADGVGSTASAEDTNVWKVPSSKKHRHHRHEEARPSFSSVASPSISLEPFDIVLVDIKKAAKDRTIQCVKRRLGDKTRYVALSYRWGELDEQMVAATEDYHARIVSFQLDDFFKLCQAMRYEPDLQFTNYVWVDAICVNQENMEKRKATIYRMNDIYIHATVIVAVPDLHAFHLSTTTTANNAIMDTIQKYRRYLYYLLVGTADAQKALAIMDHAWMDHLGIPTSGLYRRDLINDNNNKTTEEGTPGTTDSFMFTEPLMTLIMNNNHGSRSPVVDPQTKDNDQDYNYYQQVACRMMVELQRMEWQHQLGRRQNDIVQSVQFFQSIMEDWSNRAWVISEYHIAKRKTGTLKFWYNQLSCPELKGRRFFEFKFDTQPSSLRASHLRSHFFDLDVLKKTHPYTMQIIDSTKGFKYSMRHRLTKRSVLEMMLHTKTSKAEDRFHAIIPLTAKYKQYIKDRHSISSWGISDMLSVRLKLMEWLDTKDRLVLLYSHRQPMSSSASPLLPTYATQFKAIRTDLPRILTGKYKAYCNFDIHSNQDHEDGSSRSHSSNNNHHLGGGGGVSLVRTGSFDELWLRPRMYCEFLHTIPPNDPLRHLRIWRDLGLDPFADRLVAVSIPLFINLQDDRTYLQQMELPLLGSWKKNCWIMFPFKSNAFKLSIMYSMEDRNHKLPDGFRVY